MSARIRVTALALAISAANGAARADAIDGAWCHEPSGRLSIDGPAIVTPSGTALQGNYTRHYFSYVAPRGDPAAGATIEMRLLNEDTMQMRESPQATPETWHRCSPPVS